MYVVLWVLVEPENFRSNGVFQYLDCISAWVEQDSALVHLAYMPGKKDFVHLLRRSDWFRSALLGSTAVYVHLT